MSVDLVYHASKGNLFKVRRLLERGVLPDATSNTGETALFHAALAGHRHVVVDLLKYGADPNRCSVNGISPINAACVRDHVKPLAALLYHEGRLEHPTLIESAMETACRYRSRRVQKYIQNVQNVAMQNFTGDFVDVHEEDKEEDESIHDELQPGSGSCIPITDGDPLTTLHEGVRFTFIAPLVTFSNACWDRIAVTVKTSKYKEDMEKDLEMLCKLRHPRIVMILAGVSSPNTGLTSLVLDYFKLGNLHHMMYVSKLSLNLVQRINILKDISKAMGYIHKKNILHCYINSYSVLVDGNFRAKIGNFEHAQKIDEESLEGISINHINEQHAWMAPCELNGEPAHKSSDVYSFGALMWECLAIKKPWSWLTDKTIYQAVCQEYLRLPMLQDWPSTIKQILTECIGPEQERADFDTITQDLEVLQTSDLDVPEEILESALEFWLTGNRKIKQRRKSSRVRKASMISRDLSALRMDSDSDDEEDDHAKIRLLTSRRKLSSAGLSERRNTIHQGLMNVVHALQHTNKQDIRKQRDTDKYGLEVAEQLATVRSLWKTGKHHGRHRWAKETFIRRKLEGDIKRIKMKKRVKERCSDLKAKQTQQSQRVRRLSHGAESIARLRTIACKYEKWNWAKYTTGHEYHSPEDKYELVEEDYDEDVEETVIARDVLKGRESSGVHLLPLAAVNIVDLDDEDEQLEGSIEERFKDEDSVGRLIARDSEGVGTFEHKHEKVEGPEHDVYGMKVVKKEGKQEGGEEEGDDENVEGEVAKEGEDGEGKAGEVDKKDLENEKDEGEKRYEGCKDEDEDEDMDKKVDYLQDNKHCRNKNIKQHELDVRLTGRSHDTRQHDDLNMVQAEKYKSKNLDTNSSEASNQDKNAQKSSSESFLTKGISRQTSRTSEDGGSKSGRVSFSTDAVNILDEFSQWLDDYCEDIPSVSDVGDEDFKDINDVLEGNDSSREVTPENENQQSASKETLVEELERVDENGSYETDGLPIAAVDMPLPGDDDELESVQPSTSGIDFSKNT